MSRRPLFLLFGTILVAMLGVTGWASSRVALWHAGPGLKDPWTIATLFDAYAGFLTFYAWVFYKEPGATARGVWLFLVLTLGNIAMAVYVLRELRRLGGSFTPERLLLRRAA
jgi:hypothetical protein